MAVTPITYIGRLVAQDNDLPTLDTMYDVAYRYTSITASMNAAIPAFYSLNTDSDLTSSSIWSYLEDGNPATTIAADEDFTVEFWMQLEKTGLKQTIIDGARNNNLWIHLGTANKLMFDLGTTSTSHTCASYAFAASTWYHIAFVRSGGTVTYYVNGDALETWTMNVALSIPASIRYGQLWNGVTASRQFYGYLAGVCILRGAKYTAPFAPPMTPAQYEDVTSAPVELFELVGNTVTDRYGHNLTKTDISTSGDVTFLGQNTLFFNGTSSVLTTALYCGKAADFTIDWWCKPNSVSNYNNWNTVLEWRSDLTSGRGYYCHIMTKGEYIYSAPSVATSGSGYASGPTSYHGIGGNSWNHYAIVKRGGTCYFYINGVQHAVTYATSNYMWPTLLSVGKCAFTSGYYSGYVAHLRVCCGARWTGNFAVPNNLADYGLGTAQKYDITNGAPEQLSASPNTVLECNYSGAAIPITLPRGAYKLECWGASGGYYQGMSGGRGGYSCGTLTLQDTTKLYLYAGGIGEDFENYKRSSAGNVYAGGFNGGGSAKVVYYSGTTTIPSGGGGGTDIRIGADSLYARVIVAGGGSGATNGNVGYVGGGESGGGYNTSFAGKATAAGTHGAFGVGASSSPSSTNYKHSGTGAGGGWYGGGATSTYSDSDTSLPKQAGGGSGYVYAQASAQNYPSGCLLNSAHYLADGLTKAGSEAIPEINGDTACASQFGHAGYIRVTVLNVPPAIYLRTSAGWKRVRDVCTNQNTSGWTSIIESSADVIRATLASAITAVSPNNVEYVWRKCTRDANTKLLLKFDDGVTDVSGNDVALVSQGVTTSDAQSKFGGKSGYFNGSTAWIDFTVKSVFNPNADWTIDWWEYIETKVTAACIYNQTNGIHNNDRGILLGYQSSSNNEYAYVTDSASGWTIADSKTMGALTTGQWVHRAVVRSGSTYYTFRDGVQQATWTSTKSILSTATLGTIGRYANGIKYYKGYIDEFRISDVARWTSSFTAPATPHTAINIVGYVTSPSPRAYPDGEMASDGFYYERI